MTIAEILQGLDDRRLAAVPTPEWPELDGQLFARKFCGRQRAEYYAAMRKFQASEGPQFVALVVACGTVDAQGTAAFAAEDYAWIVEKDPDALGRLFRPSTSEPAVRRSPRGTNKKLRTAWELRRLMAIARAMGRSLRETLEYLGDELPLWEAEYSISPWGPEART